QRLVEPIAAVAVALRQISRKRRETVYHSFAPVEIAGGRILAMVFAAVNSVALDSGTVRHAASFRQAGLAQTRDEALQHLRISISTKLRHPFYRGSGISFEDILGRGTGLLQSARFGIGGCQHIQG
ncbi:uncharacterized protein METZ01_LOCUS508411, partial [marine metagenome]